MAEPVFRILVTGAQGFIGRNLTVRCGESGRFSVIPYGRGDDPARLPDLVAVADAIIHLAGENRPEDESAFEEVNAGLTRMLCDAIRGAVGGSDRRIPLILASSIQAERDNPYGRSKRAAEDAVKALAEETGNPAVIFRLPGVFGKWCRPNYNSVVATFCHNIARNLPIRIDNPDARLRLVYIDDVVTAMIDAVDTAAEGVSVGTVTPEYEITLDALAAQIRAFAGSRDSLVTERTGTGLIRALHATYLSYLPVEDFSYKIPQYADPRGVFVEMLKTPDCGQFSFFTAHPGVTRGGHYHHTKTEKFLVIRGEALFRFRHLLTGELAELRTSGAEAQIVETVPGWAHDITNIGTDEMIVMLWANEIFDRAQPDTVPSKV